MIKLTHKFYFLLFIFFSKTIAANGLNIDLSHFEKIEYSKTKPNTINKIGKSIEVVVDHSSSALIYKLEQPMNVKNLYISAKLKGRISYKNNSSGEKYEDDFPLRVCLIKSGKSKLNFIQKMIAPKWLLRLDKLFPKTLGIDKLHCFIFYTKKPNFSSREHPLSSYFYEQVGSPFSHGQLAVTIPITLDKETIGLWISSDGDDTKSSFSIILSEIKID